MSNKPDYDLCVIGGGINGAGIARDAAGRGLKVLLLEKGDLAQATSSASTKLVHGGLRYLEFYEFSLVRESLKERSRLLSIAPHIIWPLEFVLPHHKAVRPLWMIRAGLYLYDILGGRKKLKSSRYLNLAHHSYGQPLKPAFNKGFSYADCWVQDSRLVVLNAMDARDKGAMIVTGSKCVKLSCHTNFWQVDFEDVKTLNRGSISASMVVNAAGPWVEKLLQDNQFYSGKAAIPHIKLVKGSHIIVPRQYDGNQCYILQKNDGRIVFSIPYEERFTLIGTTDTPYAGDAMDAQIDNSEIEYLCGAVNEFFKKQITPGHIVSTYSGVRALYDDGASEARKVTRDYTIFHHDNYAAPMLSIFGGKITTYRELSERTVNKLMELSGRQEKPWTSTAILPGGDIPAGDMNSYYPQMLQRYPWMPAELLHRYCLHYGTCLNTLIGSARSLMEMGVHYGDHVYEAEIKYLLLHEFAKSADDILKRRTKLHLHISKETQQNIIAALNKKYES